MVRYVPADGRRGSGVADLVQAAHPEVVVGAGRVQAWVVGSGGGDVGGRPAREPRSPTSVPLVVDADALTGA